MPCGEGCAFTLLDDSFSVDSPWSSGTDDAVDFQRLSYVQIGSTCFLVGPGDDEPEEKDCMVTPGMIVWFSCCDCDTLFANIEALCRYKTGGLFSGLSRGKKSAGHSALCFPT